jgi:hypothetical protein
MSSSRQLRIRLWRRRLGVVAVVGGCVVAVWLSTRGTAPPERYTAAQEATDDALSRRVPLVGFDNVPVPEAIESLEKLAGVRITLDDSVAPLAAQRVVNHPQSQPYLFEALLAVIRPIGLARENYLVRADGSIVIMSTARLAEEAVWREYDVRPLLVPLGQPEPNWTGEQLTKLEEELVSVVRETVAPGSWSEDGGAIGEISLSRGRMRVRHLPDEQWMVWSLLDQFLEGDHVMRYLHERLTGAK